MPGRLRALSLLAAIALAAAACAGPGVGGSAPSSTLPPSTTAPPDLGTTTTTRVVAVPTQPTASSSTTAPTTTLPGVTACEGFTGPEVVGAVTNEDLAELSGIAFTRKRRGLVWAHNDSGNPSVVYALDPTGAVLAEVELEVDNLDWEDIAIGPRDDETDYIYLADTGDNRSERSRVDLYRFVEPPRRDRTIPEDQVERLRLTYEGGPLDVEALLIDPATGDAYLIGKEAFGDASLFAVPASAWGRGSHEAAQVGIIDLGISDLITGADISPDGSTIAVRTYTRVMLWERAPGVPIPAAMAEPPCDLTPPEETQGEAITITGTRIFTIGESVGAPVHRYTYSG